MLQQRGFPASVGTDQPDKLVLLDGKSDILQDA